jgi:hypothetical protein
MRAAADAANPLGFESGSIFGPPALGACIGGWVTGGWEPRAATYGPPELAACIGGWDTGGWDTAGWVTGGWEPRAAPAPKLPGIPLFK